MTEYEKMLWWLDSGQLIGPPDRKAIADFIRAQSAEVRGLVEIITRSYELLLEERAEAVQEYLGLVVKARDSGSQEPTTNEIPVSTDIGSSGDEKGQ